MRAGNKEKFFINGTQFVVHFFSGRYSKSPTHILLRDTTPTYDNLDHIQGNYNVVVIESIGGRAISYESLRGEDIERLKQLVYVLIDHGKVSETVKVFIAQIGSYEVWNKDLLGING